MYYATAALTFFKQMLCFMQQETIYNLYGYSRFTLLFKTNFRGHGLFPSESIPLATCTAMYLPFRESLLRLSEIRVWFSYNLSKTVPFLFFFNSWNYVKRYISKFVSCTSSYFSIIFVYWLHCYNNILVFFETRCNQQNMIYWLYVKTNVFYLA